MKSIFDKKKTTSAQADRTEDQTISDLLVPRLIGHSRSEVCLPIIACNITYIGRFVHTNPNHIYRKVIKVNFEMYF